MSKSSATKASAEVVLEGTATFLHGLGGGVGFAGVVYHWIKKQWWYLAIALLITFFHGISAWNHRQDMKRALKAATCENCPHIPSLRLVKEKGVA